MFDILCTYTHEGGWGSEEIYYGLKHRTTSDIYDLCYIVMIWLWQCEIYNKNHKRLVILDSVDIGDEWIGFTVMCFCTTFGTLQILNIENSFWY